MRELFQRFFTLRFGGKMFFKRGYQGISWQSGDSVEFSSVDQLCLTLCDPMDCSTPGFPVHHQLLELAQTHVHQVSDGHPTILSSVVPFSFCLQSFPASGSFPMSQFFTSGGQSLVVRAPQFYCRGHGFDPWLGN